MPQENHQPSPPRRDEPPTLPLPSTWRLVVAGIVIVGFLWFLYDYQRQIEEEAAGRLIESTQPAPAASTPAPSPSPSR